MVSPYSPSLLPLSPMAPLSVGLGSHMGEWDGCHSTGSQGEPRGPTPRNPGKGLLGAGFLQDPFPHPQTQRQQTPGGDLYHRSGLTTAPLSSANPSHSASAFLSLQAFPEFRSEEREFTGLDFSEAERVEPEGNTLLLEPPLWEGGETGELVGCEPPSRLSRDRGFYEPAPVSLELKNGPNRSYALFSRVCTGPGGVFSA